jgi:hypothetical protein
MTRADTPNRIRFEICVLGVARAETFYVEEQVPDGWPLPAVGALARPLAVEGPERRVVQVVSTGAVTYVELEPIDISQGERNVDEEAAALRAAGWRT